MKGTARSRDRTGIRPFYRLSGLSSLNYYPVRWILYTVLALVGLVVVVAIVGWMLPKGHRASRTQAYAAAPESVFDLLANVEDYPNWRSGVTKVEVLPDDGQGKRFREHGPDGPITFRIEESSRPARMRTRIADSSLAFGGTWTYELTRTASGGTSLTITEDGEVYNPIFRFISTFFISQTATIEKVQDAIAARLRQTVQK